MFYIWKATTIKPSPIIIYDHCIGALNKNRVGEHNWN